MTTEQTHEIVYTGPGEAGELWGGTQANFAVELPDGGAKEAAVLLNDAATRQLAQELGIENTPEFRDLAARIIGQAWLQRNLRLYRRVDGNSMVSAADLKEAPELAEALKASVAARAALFTDRIAGQH